MTVESAAQAAYLVAALLFLSYRQQGIGVLMVMVPLLALLLVTLHLFFRQHLQTYPSNSNQLLQITPAFSA